MSPMLDVSDEVRAEIGEAEAAKLIAGDTVPDRYDCTSCRTPGSTDERTSTVLFVGSETAVLAFAHAACVPSQIVRVSEEQIQSAVRTISGEAAGGSAPAEPGSPSVPADGRQAVLGVTCGQVLVGETLHPAVVVEPTGPIARPGTTGGGDEFLPLLIEAGFMPVTELDKKPGPLPGWSVLMAMGKLHAVLQPAEEGQQPTSWWQAHQPLPVTDEWRTTANRTNSVLVYAAPAGSIGQQPREDLMRDALERAAERGVLVAATMPLAGT
ncbi:MULTISPECIES: hypothetical protein [unclassified Streptomyces]|uniref:hypothetical protein n=1 Tax=unclassified Streptomyces TaxID=2593676 RepID=UPI0022B6E0F0|nr:MULTISPECIES: hypothetical protein [unclassified Streptomyces]MCZ7413506.1 hypothetical protein [Streptomyces sp. WMMC897]MCZ7430500.1 hypothetical protein [Streptomyces sp. WMMC1477]